MADVVVALVSGSIAEMVTGELAGAFEAPLYGMLAVQEAMAKGKGALVTGSVTKPVVPTPKPRP